MMNFNKLILVYLLLLSSVTSIRSQNDSLYNAIASYQDTTSHLIGNARNMMISKLNEMDFKAMSALKDFLLKKENTDYISLYPFERWMLDYVLQDYSDILVTALTFDSAYYSSFKYRIRPAYDLLEMKLIDYSSEHQYMIENYIDNSSLTAEQKEFLKLSMNYILLATKQPANTSEILNNQANTFISSYPQSDYVAFVKKNIRFQYKPSDLGFEMYFGLGIRMNSGNIKNTIDEGILIDLGMGMSYKKWSYEIYLLAGPVQLQKDVPVKDKIWLKGSEGNYLLVGLGISRNILESKRHRLSPYLGFGATAFTPYQETIDKDPYYEDIKVKFENIIFGLNYQYKYPVKTHGVNSGFQSLFGCLNIRYALSWQPTKNELYKGFIHYITLTWGFDLRGVQREL